MTSDMLKVATEARSRSLGPFNPSFNIQNLLLEGLKKVRLRLNCLSFQSVLEIQEKQK